MTDTDQPVVPVEEAAPVAVDAEREKVALVALGKKARNQAALQALYDDMDAIESLLAAGDVGKIATNTTLRKAFIITRCVRLGIPIHPEAVIFIPSDAKLKVYHTAVCASLVRNAKGWTSKRLEELLEDGIYTVWVRVYDPKQPDHFADNLGTIPMVDGEGVPLKPMERATNKKKAFTQAERRATFSLAGLAGEDPREDGGLQGYYPDEEPTKELKVIEPKARLVSAPATATPVEPAMVDGVPVEAPAAAAPKKRRIVRRADGSVVPQPQPQGDTPSETSPRMPTEGSGAAPQPAQGDAAPVGGVKGPAPAAVAPEPPETGPGAAMAREVCEHPGMQRWLATAPAGKTHPCPDCGEVLVAPTPTPAACTHSMLKHVQPGHTYVCPAPPEGCGQEFKVPGKRADKPAVSTTPMPVKPRAVRLVKRVVPK